MINLPTPCKKYDRRNPNILVGQYDYRTGNCRFMIEDEGAAGFAVFFLGGHLVRDGFPTLEAACKFANGNWHK